MIHWKVDDCQQVMEENLFHLNPHLSRPLISLRTLCYLASNWDLTKIDPKTVYSLPDFMKTQEDQRVAVSTMLQDLNEKVRRIVFDACEVDLRQFLIKNEFRKTPQQKSEEKTLSASGKVGSLMGAASGTVGAAANAAGAGIGDDSEESKSKHAEHAAIRTECRKLTKYIRLSDYFVIDTLVTLAMERCG